MDDLPLFNGLPPIADVVQDIALDLEYNGYPGYGPLIAEYSRRAEEEIAALKAKLASLETSQARWVKCSERMPEKAGECLFVRISDGEVFQELVWWDARPGMKYQMWNAWLENVPEYVP